MSDSGQVSAQENVPESAEGLGLFVIGGIVKEIVGSQRPQILQDHLSSLLQVHNLVILFGSGASFHLGSPQTRNLTNDEVAALIAQAGADVSEQDVDLLSAINPDDNGDLEQLLNGLQLAASLATQAGQPGVTLGVGASATNFGEESLRELRGKINRALAYACRLPSQSSPLAPPFDVDPLLAHRTFLARVVGSRRTNLPRPRIFTTNYDLIIERALDQLGYPYIDGFSGTVDRRLNLAHYGLDFHRVETTSQSVVERAEGAVYLHKVHGSLNWRSAVERDPATNLESIEVRQVCEGEDETHDLVLVYPTTSKEGDSLAYPYSDLLRLLGDAVQQPDTAVIVVGYGFADAHINRLLLRSLATNPALNIFVADPKAVLAEDAILQLTADANTVGRSLAAAPVETKPTAIAALATNADSRIAVLTGAVGGFARLAELMPDRAVQARVSSPVALAALIDALSPSRSASAPITQAVQHE